MAEKKELFVYPHQSISYKDIGVTDMKVVTSHSGITLRDYFASKVMNVLSPKTQKGFESPTDNDLKEWAEKCYRRADAMLKQREL